MAIAIGRDAKRGHVSRRPKARDYIFCRLRIQIPDHTGHISEERVEWR